MNVLVYVSGHGYGHAVRMVAVLRALRRLQPAWRVIIRTAAPQWLFESLTFNGVEVFPAQMDAGAIEDTPLRINAQATREGLIRFMDQSDALVAQECAWIKRANIQLIIADFPWVAGAIGGRTGVPCIGIGNFCWDWILAPLLAGEPQTAEFLRQIRTGYAQMQVLLKLPFSHAMKDYARVIEVPLVTRPSERPPEQVRQAIGLGPAENRPLIYWAVRGKLACEALYRAAREGSEFIFVYPDDELPDPPANTRRVLFGRDMNFADIVAAADTVIAKPGYGVAAACTLNQTNLLYTRRIGFREDEVMIPELVRYVRAREIARADFESGNWCEALRALRTQPAPQEKPAVNGAEVCAQIIANPGSLNTRLPAGK